MSKKTRAERNLKFETLQLHVGQENPDPATGARAVPIYQTSSFVFNNSDHAAARFGLQDAGNIYGRLTNPTEDVFEQRMAALEGGVAALAVASGAAAINYTIINLAQKGDHIVSAKNIYGGSYNLLAHTLPQYGISTTFVDVFDLDEVRAAVQENTKAIYIETLGNPNSDVVDIEALAKTLNVDEAWLMGFDSPMEPQSANVSNENRFNSDDERTLILSYRKLNDKNKKKCYIYTNTLLTNQQMEDELIVKAAHKYANVDVTEEMKQHADDIMNNPSEWE